MRIGKKTRLKMIINTLYFPKLTFKDPGTKINQFRTSENFQFPDRIGQKSGINLVRVCQRRNVLIAVIGRSTDAMYFRVLHFCNLIIEGENENLKF